MEYLFVKFPERRKVTVDGLIQGETDRVLALSPGTYTVALEPATRCRPLRQTVVLVGTTLMKPSVITFVLDPSGS
jgi:hypothetical protein